MFDTSTIRSEKDLVGLAVALGAADVGTAAKRALTSRAKLPSSEVVEAARAAIAAGEDPLGDVFCALRTPEARRPSGATYTPPAIVSAITEWAAARDPVPVRVVDPGAGSGRFIVAAGRALPDAELIAVEMDPLAALLTRAHLVVAGLAPRARVIVSDYRKVTLPKVEGRTAFIGNPPYVRHHDIDPASKAWLVEEAKRFGLKASQLAGLHVHFFMQTAKLARRGDVGVFVTAAEWLDVNYGDVLRKLLVGPLGGSGLHIVEPKALPFEDAATTAVVTCFEVGSQLPFIHMRRVEALADLAPLECEGNDARSAVSIVSRARLEESSRWRSLTEPARTVPEGYVELGELCRVHRGQVTGFNALWIEGEHTTGLPESVFYPTVTKAKDLFTAGEAIQSTRRLRRVVDLPADLSRFSRKDRRIIDAFLECAKKAGADQGFIAQHRKAWWSVGLRDPAPILATYMARRPPAFVRNLAGARHINVAHGLYPKVPMSDAMLDNLARFLNKSTCLGDGRTYAGGLTKFEPKEMERLMVPGPDLLVNVALWEVA